MLILARKLEGEVVIGLPGQLAVWTGDSWRPVEPVVVRLIKSNTVEASLGVTADKAVAVNRGEIYDRILSGEIKARAHA